MRTIEVQARFGFARAGVAVLRTLRIVGRTIHYRDFATAIDLFHDGERWSEQHNLEVRDLLVLIAAVERQGGTHTRSLPLPFELVVPESGKPNQEFLKKSRIVSD